MARALGRLLIIAAGVFVVLTCYARRPEGSPPQDIPTGSTFKLHRALTVPSGGSALYFQDTRLVKRTAIQPGYVYCAFEMNHPSPTAHKVRRQVFLVLGVDYNEGQISGTRHVSAVTVIHLGGEEEGDSGRLSCRWPEPAPTAGFVTANEIEGALGDYFILKRAR
jgi:hypothetical protein